MQCESAVGEFVAPCVNFATNRCIMHGVPYCTAGETTQNGCNRVAAEDQRGEALVTVRFISDSTGYDYAPECILVSVGTTVRFEGDFGTEPLVGGLAPTPDPTSPFSPPVTSGTTHDVVLHAAGMFPYFGGDFGTAREAFGLPWGAVIVDDTSP